MASKHKRLARHLAGTPSDSEEEISIFKYELLLLSKIAEKSSDYLLGQRNPAFAKSCGGKQKLLDELATACRDHEDWLSGFDVA